MKKLFEKHVDEVEKGGKVDVGKVRESKYLHEFDRYDRIIPETGKPLVWALTVVSVDMYKDLLGDILRRAHTTGTHRR